MLIFSLVFFVILKAVRYLAQIFPVNKLLTIKTFEKQLGINLPWKIDDISFKPVENNTQELHVFLSFTQGSIFKDKTKVSCPIHSTYNKTWQHIDFEEMICYLHCKVPRIKTTEGSILTLDVPWAKTGSQFSWGFETNVIQQIQNGKSFGTIGTLLNKDSHSIWNIFNRWINAAYTADVIDQELSVIGIDEISDQGKSKQITVTIDLKNERVIRVTQGIGKEALQDIRHYLSSKGILPEQIKHVTGPLSSDLQSSADFKTCFSNAEYHVDRVYILRLLNDAIDQIRKKESYRTKTLTEAAALFVKHPALLSDKQKKDIQKLSGLFPRVGQAYDLKNAFFALWDQSSLQSADTFLESWYQKVNNTRLFPLKRAAEQIQTHKQNVILFLDLPTDATTMEQLHEKSIAATKRTKGLKNFENVSNMILLCCGQLGVPSYPENSISGVEIN